MTHQNSLFVQVQTARQLYNEEHSFPSVYRKLVRNMEPDQAIQIIKELKESLAIQGNTRAIA